MHIIKRSFLWRWVNSSFIRRVQIMANMHKRCSIEVIPEEPLLSIRWHQPREPVVSHNYRWFHLVPATNLQRSLCHGTKLLNNVFRPSFAVDFRKHVSMVEKD